MINLTDYKEFAGINNPKNDIEIQSLIDMANDFIVKYCNTSFSPVSITEQRVTNTGYMILLPYAPIISVEEVRLVKAEDEILDPTQYILEPDEGVVDIIDYVINLPSNPYSVSISYTYGHSTTPPAVRQAALELVTHYRKREFNKSKDLGNGQAIDFTDPAVVPVQVRSLLDTYRVL